MTVPCETASTSRLSCAIGLVLAAGGMTFLALTRSSD